MKFPILFPILYLVVYFFLNVDALFLEDVGKNIKNQVARLQQIHSLVHSVVEKFLDDPNSTLLWKAFPEAAELLHEQAERLKLCYDATIGDEKLSFFEVPLKEVIHKYLVVSGVLDNSLEEIQKRIHNLVYNIKSLAEHIIACVRGDHSGYSPTRVGLTKFSAMSPEELTDFFSKGLRTMGRKKGQKIPNQDNFMGEFDDIETCKVDDFTDPLPEEFDYRDQSVVSPIKDQGQCGSCYLFASLATIESAYMLKYNTTGVSFSERYLLNCYGKDQYSKNPCEGGEPHFVYKLASKHGAIWTNQTEQYLLENKTINPDKCINFPSTEVRAYVTNYCKSHISTRDDDQLKKMILKYGPVTVSFKSPTSEDDGPIASVWANLKDSLNTPCNTTNEVDHVMAVVGWNKDYWLIKNSYGTKNPTNPIDWGNHGYVYLNKTLAKSCGVFGDGKNVKEGGDGFSTGDFYFPFVK